MERVVIVGGGISGLATAAWMDEPPLVLEAAEVPGGLVRSDLEGGRVFDRAANGWLDNEPKMRELLARIGATSAIVSASPAYSTRWIFADGNMHPAPLGIVQLARSELLPASSKLRLLVEPLAPRGPDTQSIGGFVARRLGPAFVDRVVAPMVAGIYGGDPWQLSLKATFPRLHDLEDAYGSLVLALLRLRGAGAPAGKLQTFAGGAGELATRLAAHLGDRLRCSVPVTALLRDGEGWRVETPGGAIRTRAVVLATPAPTQARLLRATDPDLAGSLASIPYAPIAVVSTTWEPDSFPDRPRGFGVLVARGEPMGGVLGTVFASEVFPHQARPGEILLRTMIGGAIAPRAVDDDDLGLLRRADAAHRAFFGALRGGPSAHRIVRHSLGIPQYSLGHPSRVRFVRSREHAIPGLFLVGNHLDGIGVKDCAREGARTADRVRSYLGR